MTTTPNATSTFYVFTFKRSWIFRIMEPGCNTATFWRSSDLFMLIDTASLLVQWVTAYLFCVREGTLVQDDNELLGVIYIFSVEVNWKFVSHKWITLSGSHACPISHQSQWKTPSKSFGFIYVPLDGVYFIFLTFDLSVNHQILHFSSSIKCDGKYACTLNNSYQV